MSEEIADDQMNLRVPSTFKENVKKHCELLSDLKVDYISVTQYMIDATKEKIEREKLNG